MTGQVIDVTGDGMCWYCFKYKVLELSYIELIGILNTRILTLPIKKPVFIKQRDSLLRHCVAGDANCRGNLKNATSIKLHHDCYSPGKYSKNITSPKASVISKNFLISQVELVFNCTRIHAS